MVIECHALSLSLSESYVEVDKHIEHTNIPTILSADTQLLFLNPSYNTITMIRFSFIAALIICILCIKKGNAFAPSSSIIASSRQSSSELHLFGLGEPKDDGSPGDYLCKDCGYVYTKGEWKSYLYISINFTEYISDLFLI